MTKPFVTCFGLPWLQTLFVYVPSIPSSTCTQLLEIALCERSVKVFFKGILALLTLLQPTLLNLDFEGVLDFLGRMPDGERSFLRGEVLLGVSEGIRGVTRRGLLELEVEVRREWEELESC